MGVEVVVCSVRGSVVSCSELVLEAPLDAVPSSGGRSGIVAALFAGVTVAEGVGGSAEGDRTPHGDTADDVAALDVDALELAAVCSAFVTVRSPPYSSCEDGVSGDTSFFEGGSRGVSPFSGLRSRINDVSTLPGPFRKDSTSERASSMSSVIVAELDKLDSIAAVTEIQSLISLHTVGTETSATAPASIIFAENLHV